jgi:hypothetical protein
MKRIILEVEGQVTPLSSKTHISYNFYLGQPGGKLWISFAYEPKNLEDRELAKMMIFESIDKYTEADQRERLQAKWESYLPLKNLITVSVDDPEGHTAVQGTGMIPSSCYSFPKRERLRDLSGEGSFQECGKSL